MYINIADLKANLAKMVDLVQTDGKSFLVMRYGKPVAMLTIVPSEFSRAPVARPGSRPLPPELIPAHGAVGPLQYLDAAGNVIPAPTPAGNAIPARVAPEGEGQGLERFDRLALPPQPPARVPPQQFNFGPAPEFLVKRGM